ncbi:hypothetical protein H6F43_03315 [Leptolyngbya sp. FACHB-36]|uniref:hypothetical protein n=1 Tax=Leptolyngbya sp. FACHB-36 TaxID=2692808 RepID=UPI001680F798|nr:hypothetical protein [Leptolyngbya sp. FACHB-36]MBD2019213.1 hypothetical protein [Leptolyngbya sp. FACHB-36]
MPGREVPQVCDAVGKAGAEIAGCAGMVPSQVHQYVGKLLGVLEEHYGIKKFASQTRLFNAG